MSCVLWKAQETSREDCIYVNDLEISHFEIVIFIVFFPVP